MKEIAKGFLLATGVILFITFLFGVMFPVIDFLNDKVEIFLRGF